MANFGRIPKGTGYGKVPKFIFRLPGVRPGPKALYCSLCTNASPEGILWRSLTKLGKEFGVSTRQIQRWVNHLERAGALVRMGWMGTSNRFLVIRDEKGVPWAKREAAKNIVARRVTRSSRTRTAEDSCLPATTTPMSPEPDIEVVPAATPMSHKHNLTNQNKLTNPLARQGESNARAFTPNSKTWGLKHPKQEKRAEEVQSALNAMGASHGWEILAAMSTEQIATELARSHGLRLTEEEKRLFLTLGT